MATRTVPDDLWLPDSRLACTGTRVDGHFATFTLGYVAFAVDGLPPSAEEWVADAETPGRQDIQTSAAKPRTSTARTSFTWRLTADQALVLDDMTLRFKRQLDRVKLDKAEMLRALVGLAEDNPAVFGDAGGRDRHVRAGPQGQAEPGGGQDGRR